MSSFNSPDDLATFYEVSSSKSSVDTQHDVESAHRKAIFINKILPQHLIDEIHTVLDFGCGYGALISDFFNLWQLKLAIGVDFSKEAISFAQRTYARSSLDYLHLSTLDPHLVSDAITKISIGSFDAICLIDLLEHVPDCSTLICELSRHTKYFIIKLPIESSFLDNYIFPKEYPSSRHSNGHLREFNANNVHYFVRHLGLTPLSESLYLYCNKDLFPTLPPSATVKQRFSRLVIVIVKTCFRLILPKRLFMRFVGGGGYVCIATYNSTCTLVPG